MPPPARHANLTGLVTVVITLLGWSSIPLFLKYFTDHIDAWTSNGWRYGFSALLWAPVLLIGYARRSLPLGLWKAALIPSLINACGQVCFTWAHYKIEPGLLTFGLRSQMLFVAAGAYLLFPMERPVIRSRWYLYGLVALMVGTAITILTGDETIDFTRAAGITLAIVSGLTFASYGLSVRKCMAGYNSVLAFAAISQYTALAMVALMVLLGDRAGLSALNMSNAQIGWLLASAVIGIALGHVFYYISIARLGVAVSAGVLQLQPFFVAIASYILFRERLTESQWAGGIVAVLGAMAMLYVQQRVSRQQRIDQRMLAIAEGESGS
jgi:drug/metabolite transporter (DMT)-like permease